MTTPKSFLQISMLRANTFQSIWLSGKRKAILTAKTFFKVNSPSTFQVLVSRFAAIIQSLYNWVPVVNRGIHVGRQLMKLGWERSKRILIERNADGILSHALSPRPSSLAPERTTKIHFVDCDFQNRSNLEKTLYCEPLLVPLKINPFLWKWLLNWY